MADEEAPPSRGRDYNVQLKLRFKESLRARLEGRADRNEASLNSEIVRRLEDSLLLDEGHGNSRETALLLSAIGTTIQEIETHTGRGWHEDAVTHYAVRAAIQQMLDDNRPRTMPEGWDKVVQPFFAKMKDLLQREAEARDRLDAFERDHPETTGPDAISVQVYGMFGKTIEAAAPAEPEVAAEHQRLKDELAQAEGAVREVREEFDEAHKPYDDMRVSAKDFGLAAATTASGRYRIVREG